MQYAVLINQKMCFLTNPPSKPQDLQQGFNSSKPTQGQKFWRMCQVPSWKSHESSRFLLYRNLTEAKPHPHSPRLLEAETVTILLMFYIWIALKQVYALEK